MFKNRKFLVGLGTGLIAGAILVQLGNIGAEAQQQNLDKPAPSVSLEDIVWTKEQIREEASKLGQVLIPEEEYLSLQTATKEPAPTAEPTPDLADTEAPRLVYVYDGMNSSQVEEYLFLAGIINDRAQFQEEIRKQGLSRKLIAGIYSFDPNTSVQAIIAELTKNR